MLCAGPQHPIQPGNVSSLQQGMELQGLPNSAAFQSMRSGEQQMQAGVQPAANQALKPDQGQPSGGGYSLFKLPSSSLAGAQSVSSQVRLPHTLA